VTRQDQYGQQGGALDAVAQHEPVAHRRGGVGAAAGGADLLQEYARHLGHLDVARQLIDGVTGE